MDRQPDDSTANPQAGQAAQSNVAAVHTGGQTNPSDYKELAIAYGKQFLSQCKIIIAAPFDFYKDFPETGGFKDPAIFVATVGGVNAIFTTAMELITGHYHVSVVIAGVMAFLMINVSVLACAGLTYFLSNKLAGEGNFEATYRICAYSSAPALLLWMPIIGLFALLYALFLIKLGIEHVHKLSSSRASLIVGMQVGVGILIGILMVLRSVATLIGGHGG